MELRYCETCGDIIKIESQDEKMEASDRFICPRCQGAGGEAKPKPQGAEGEGFQGILNQGGLNLFSPSTVAVKRKEMEAVAQKRPDLKLEEPKSSIGSTNPARSARKLQFRCLHCRAILQVRPVPKASRMVCPKCKGTLFIDETGVVSKKPPLAAGKEGAKPGGAPDAATRPAADGSVRPGSSRTNSEVPGSFRTPSRPPSSKVVPRPPSSKAPSKPPSSNVLSKPPSFKVPSKPPSSKIIARAPSSRIPGKPPSARLLGRHPAPSQAELPAEGTPDLSDRPGAVSGDAREVFPTESAEPLGIHAAAGGSEAISSADEVMPEIDGLDLPPLDDLEAELSREDAEGSSHDMETARMTVDPDRLRRDFRPGWKGLVRMFGSIAGAVLLTVVLAAPLFIAGIHCVAARGEPRTAVEGRSFTPELERLGQTVQKGKEALLRLSAKVLGK